MKRREAREREQAEARQRADRHRDELIARLRGEAASGAAGQADQPPVADVDDRLQRDAMADKTPNRPPKKKNPKA